MNSSDVMLPVSQQNTNIIRLSAAQALAGANSVVFYATGAIAGNALAPDRSLATLPVTIFVLGMAACILPFGALARRRGRQAVFMIGTLAGALTGLIAAAAVVLGSFALFNLSAFLGGAYATVALSFRFAATDGVSKQRQARALSLVMGGGVVAGILGPSLVTGTMGLWSVHPFAATFVAQALLAVITGIILRGVKAPAAVTAQAHGGRPMREIVRQPGFARTVFGGAISFMIMNFLMTAAPLSMHMQGMSQQASNLGIQWHVIAMYGPGFFTGKLINRFGANRIGAAGLVITALSIATGLAGNDVVHYWLALILLGLGWNFGFTGASAKIMDYHRPEEKTRVQSLNDFIIFGVMMVGSFSSGALLNSFGWRAVLLGSIVPVALALAAVLSNGLSHRQGRS